MIISPILFEDKNIFPPCFVIPLALIVPLLLITADKTSSFPLEDRITAPSVAFIA